MLTRQIPLQLLDVRLEFMDRRGATAQLRYRRVATSDPEDRSSTRLDLNTRNGAGGDRRMSRDRIRDADAQLQDLRDLGGRGEPDEGGPPSGTGCHRGSTRQNLQLLLGGPCP